MTNVLEDLPHLANADCPSDRGTNGFPQTEGRLQVLKSSPPIKSSHVGWRGADARSRDISARATSDSVDNLSAVNRRPQRFESDPQSSPISTIWINGWPDGVRARTVNIVANSRRINDPASRTLAPKRREPR
jgi:hypothetical protein